MPVCEVTHAFGLNKETTKKIEAPGIAAVTGGHTSEGVEGGYKPSSPWCWGKTTRLAGWKLRSYSWSVGVR